MNELSNDDIIDMSIAAMHAGNRRKTVEIERLRKRERRKEIWTIIGIVVPIVVSILLWILTKAF